MIIAFLKRHSSSPEGHYRNSYNFLKNLFAIDIEQWKDFCHSSEITLVYPVHVFEYSKKKLKRHFLFGGYSIKKENIFEKIWLFYFQPPIFIQLKIKKNKLAELQWTASIN